MARNDAIRAGGLALALALAPAALSAGTGGDPVKGERVFRKCASCHMVGTDARNRTGPVLNGVLSSRAAGKAGYKYSAAMKKAGDEGLHWNPETLDAFLADPRGYLPKTRMTFRGMTSDRDRADVIAYLATFSGGEMAARRDADFTVSPGILAIEGDREYGEYLSSECTTCHRPDGDDDGIPSITGWHSEDFVTALHAYRAKHRENQVMQMITGRLGDEEIAALAAYFGTLGQ